MRGRKALEEEKEKSTRCCEKGGSSGDNGGPEQGEKDMGVKNRSRREQGNQNPKVWRGTSIKKDQKLGKRESNGRSKRRH